LRVVVGFVALRVVVGVVALRGVDMLAVHAVLDVQKYRTLEVVGLGLDDVVMELEEF
jgi:hypothetical protein